MASYTSAISPTSLTLDVGESGEVRIGLNVQVSGSGFDISADDSSIASVSWSTTGAKTVSVTVTGLSPGSTKLTLTNGKTVSVKVNGTSSGGGDSGGGDGGDDAVLNGEIHKAAVSQAEMLEVEIHGDPP